MEKLGYNLNPKGKNHDFVNTRGGSFYQIKVLKSASRSILKTIDHNRGFRPFFKVERK